MTDNEKLFRQKVEKLTEVYVAKNTDYGDSFALSLDKYGILASLIRMGDKMNRIDSLYDKPTSEVDESLVDSLEDLANYAIMTAIWLEKQVEDDGETEEVTFFASDNSTFTVKYYDDDDYDDDFDGEGTHNDYFSHEFDDLFDDDDDDDYDGSDEKLLGMLSDIDGKLLDMILNIDSEDDESEDVTDDFYSDGEPKFRIKRRPKGGLSNKDFWDMIRDLYDEEGD